MALDTNATKLTNLFNPQVVSDLVRKKLVDQIKFSPLATVMTNLQGRPGSVLTLPSYAYIGDATDVVEGADIPIGQLVENTTTATIKKAGRGVQLTDEAVLSGYGDPASEAVSQLITAIASKVDNDMLTTLGTIGSGMTYAYVSGSDAAENVADALVKFGEDIEGQKALLCSPGFYAKLRKTGDWIPNTEIGAQAIISGRVGMVHGCEVIVSNKLTKSTGEIAYIVKPGALALILKRDAMVETDRDIINKSTIMTADEHYVTYLYDASKAVKITGVN